MRAVWIDRNGGPEVLDYRDGPDLEPGTSEILVKVEASGVNFRDIYDREGRGYAPPPPTVLGYEGAGVVVEAGSDVTGVKAGDRVAWVNGAGSYAEQIVLDPDLVVPVPDNASSELAAAVILQGTTAQCLSGDSYPVQPGDWVVVHAAAGGVGLLLTQLVKLRGGNVLATTSTDEKASLAREAGADEVASYDDFVGRAKELTGGEGVAAVYDGVGQTTFYAGLEALRPLGTMVIYGAASGQPDPLPVQMLASLGSLYVQRPSLFTYTRTPEMLRARAGATLEQAGSGKLEVRIGATYPLAETRRAQEDLASRKTTGKLILVP